MNDQTYVCAICNQAFIKGWSDEEAIAELENDFVGFSLDQCKIVCDDCY